MFILLHNFMVLANYFIIKGGLWSNLKEVIVFEEKKKREDKEKTDDKDFYEYEDEDEDDLNCYCGLCYSIHMVISLFTRRLLINTHSVE